jgi:ATP-dependent RNA helicase RhlE
LNKLTFDALGIGASLCRALDDIGYEHPTPIQHQAIPPLLEGSDLLGLAQTGTGKTAAFSLPILEMLLADRVKAEPKCPRVLVLAPTRELAGQIRDEIAGYARHTKIRYTCIFGGVGANPQIKALAKGVEILVATPGRLLDLENQGHLNLGEVDYLVLDEADRLLDMGFIRDIRRVLRLLPEDRQSLLFSATMPREVQSLADEILYRPVRIEVTPKKVTVEKIEQFMAVVDNADKPAVLEKLLFQEEVSRAIVFTRTKHGANRVAKKLVKAGIVAEAIHGNKSQNARQRALEAFKSGEAWVLVATDIAARGIDIDGISHVINFELPHEPESYVHRIGRTARAGASGVAWSLIDPSEMKRMRAIERLTRIKPGELSVQVPVRSREDADEDGRSRGTPAGGNTGGNRRNGNGQQAGGRNQRSSGNGESGGQRRRRRRPRRRADAAA